MLQMPHPQMNPLYKLDLHATVKCKNVALSRMMTVFVLTCFTVYWNLPQVWLNEGSKPFVLVYNVEFCILTAQSDQNISCHILATTLCMS